MGGLSKPRAPQNTKFIAVTASEIAPIDPTLELTQPGGPHPPGRAILTDGLGGYIIEETLRPYYLSFSLCSNISKEDYCWFSHQGIPSCDCGPILPSRLNLIAVTISTNVAASRSAVYRFEIVRRVEHEWEEVTSVLLEQGRKIVLSGLSAPLISEAELGVRVIQLAGKRSTKLDKAICLIELER